MDQQPIESIIQVFSERGVHFTLDNDKCESLLHKAAAIGDENLVELCLAQGLDINVVTKQKLTPLHVAVQLAQIDVVKLLLTKNAAINTQSNSGDSPLHEALKNKSITLIELLLHHGADPNYVNTLTRESAFHKSFSLRNERLTMLFLAHQANVNLKNFSGENALHLACIYSTEEVVQSLLKMNLNVHESTTFGLFPRGIMQ